MLKTLKLRGAALAAVLCMTDTCLGIDPRLVKSSLASASLLLNRESGGDCPNVQPLEGSKDATVRKVVVLLIRTPLTAEGSSNHILLSVLQKRSQQWLSHHPQSRQQRRLQRRSQHPREHKHLLFLLRTGSAILLRARKRLHPIPSMPRQRGLQLHHDRHKNHHK